MRNEPVVEPSSANWRSRVMLPFMVSGCEPLTPKPAVPAPLPRAMMGRSKTVLAAPEYQRRAITEPPGSITIGSFELPNGPAVLIGTAAAFQRLMPPSNVVLPVYVFAPRNVPSLLPLLVIPLLPLITPLYVPPAVW